MSKPRPVVVVQSERLESSSTAIVCPLTSFDIDASTLFEPSATNGLLKPSSHMAWKTGVVKKARLGKRIGELSDSEMEVVCAQLRRALGL